MSRSTRGFTLIELLIAVSLFALLMSLLFAGIHLGTRNIGRRAARLDHAADVALAQEFLRSELADAQQVLTTASGRSLIAFDGRENGLDFVSPGPEAIATGGLQVLSLGLGDAPEGGGTALLVGWRPYDGPASANAEPVSRTVLLDHVRTASFAYFGSPRPGEAPDWHASWSGMGELPSLVRLSVVFADGEVMPDLTVALRLSPGAIGRRTFQ